MALHLLSEVKTHFQTVQNNYEKGVVGKATVYKKIYSGSTLVWNTKINITSGLQNLW
jgi:hypothetical protein